jgi:hypothetical protein
MMNSDGHRQIWQQMNDHARAEHSSQVRNPAQSLKRNGPFQCLVLVVSSVGRDWSKWPDLKHHYER